MQRLSGTDYGALIRIDGGCEVRTWPHPSQPHYHVIAHRCGYGDDLMAYCFEHDFCHLFLCERLANRLSPVLYEQAGGTFEDFRGGTWPAWEEIAVQAFQRWLRANERPIIAGVDWDALKAEALALLDQEWKR